MKSLCILLAVSLLGMSLNACDGDTAAAPTAPVGPRLDNGSGFGSGNRVGTDSTATTTDGDSPSGDRNGGGLGSGN